MALDNIFGRDIENAEPSVISSYNRSYVFVREQLIKYRQISNRIEPQDRIIQTERSDKVSAQTIVSMFSAWYKDLGFDGCSSHSGRRTFITKGAKKITSVGGSLRDVQYLAGHTSLATTQRYIDGDTAAQRKLIDLM